MAHLYLHIPYCRRACTYCDFYFSTSFKSQALFLEALLQELELQKHFFNSLFPLQTIYFGGGTPSLLPIEILERILHQVHKLFSIAPEVEVTLEANPEDVTFQKLKAWQDLGINRLSLGIQSLFDSELSFMNRGHTAKQGEKAIFLAQEVGFTNISVDLIYATPTLSLKEWEYTLEKIVSYKIPHISAYCLTVEHKTQLAYQIKKGWISMPQEESFLQQFELLTQKLESAGYEHYEISNFAQKNYRSRHNTAYWLQKPYLGVGPSAHSYTGKARFNNVANVWKYIELIQTQKSAISFIENLSENQLINEFILTRLRLQEGIPLLELKENWKYDLLVVKKEIIEKLQNLGLIIVQNNALRLTFKGKLQADAITLDLFI
ncbi:MAG: radical SAM family heme chaperone HemW [Bacteroidia bacterium]|nr:radical SAM family heme chaperone HemW [Bacteroidia bacterium]MDW8158333.1 radical SAM family heme chaperone HemW [Bacteroidia bacterium]